MYFYFLKPDFVLLLPIPLSAFRIRRRQRLYETEFYFQFECQYTLVFQQCLCLFSFVQHFFFYYYKTPCKLLKVLSVCWLVCFPSTLPYITSILLYVISVYVLAYTEILFSFLQTCWLPSRLQDVCQSECCSHGNCSLLQN